MAWSVKQYITKDEYLANGGQPINAPNDAPASVDETYTLLLRIASQETDWLTGGKIGWDLTTLGSWYDNVNGREVTAQERQDGVRQAVLLVANNLVERGLSWLRGASSLSVGGTYSVSQQNPNQPDYIPPPITRQLRSIGLYDTLEVIQFNPWLPKDTQTTPTPPPPTPGNWNAQKQFETYESQFVSTPTISVDFNTSTNQVEWHFVGTIPAEWNASKQYDALKTQVVAGNNITITPNDTNKTLTISSSGGQTPNFKTGQEVAQTGIGDAQDDYLQTKAIINNKVAVKLDKTTFSTFMTNSFNPLNTEVRANTQKVGENNAAIVQNNTDIYDLTESVGENTNNITALNEQVNQVSEKADNNQTQIQGLKDTRLNRNFDNATLPQTFNNKLLKGTSTGGIEPADIPTAKFAGNQPTNTITLSNESQQPQTLNAVPAYNKENTDSQNKLFITNDQGQTQLVNKDVFLTSHQPNYQQGQIATLDANKNVVFQDAGSIIPPDFWLSNITRENFANIIFKEELGKTWENQANDFIQGGPLELKTKTMTYKGIANVVFTPSALTVVGQTYLSFTCNVNAPNVPVAKTQGENQPWKSLAFNQDYHFVVQAPYLPDLQLTPDNWGTYTTTIGGTLEVLHPITTIRSDTVHNFAKYKSFIFPPTLHYFENGVTGIFENHKGITNIVFPHNVRYIGYRCFYNSSVSSISFSEGLGGEKNICQHIGRDAFNSCTNLKQITFPAKLKSIGDVAFYAVNLNRVEFLGTPPADPADFIVGQSAFHNTPVSAITGNEAGAWRLYMTKHYRSAWRA